MWVNTGKVHQNHLNKIWTEKSAKIHRRVFGGVITSFLFDFLVNNLNFWKLCIK